MITRIVKMQFTESGLAGFYTIFRDSSPVIRNFEGCLSVKMVQDTSSPETVFTISEWKDEEALEKYRQSDFFRKTWTATKQLFSGKPEAWSTKERT